MLKINDKTFLNIQEAIQWLMDNNALPFQCTANYAANTEIGLGTIVNPTIAKVRIGSLIFFADSKVSTVTGITDNGFIVSDKYNDLVDDVVYISDVTLLSNGHLIVYFSNGTSKDAGQVKEVTGFTINSQQHLVVSYNDGTSVDLGAIFTGNITISGNLSVSGDATIGGDISGAGNVLATGKFLGDGVEIKTIDDIEGQGYIDVLKPLRVSALTSANNEISAQKPIVEVMTGYSFTPLYGDKPWTPIYVGVSKNGNTLHLVVFGSVNFAGGTTVFADIGYITMPASVCAKLIPYTTDNDDTVLSQKDFKFWNKTIPASLDTGVTARLNINKADSVSIRIRIRKADDVIPAGDYYFRLEDTFLLSPNFAA